MVADASVSDDAEAGQPDTSFDPRCDELVSDYQTRVEQFRSCNDVDDCKVIEGTGTCDSAISFGDSSGDAVNRDFEYPPNWDARVEACADFLETLPQEADVGPAENLRCEQQKCVADGSVCRFSFCEPRCDEDFAELESGFDAVEQL